MLFVEDVSRLSGLTRAQLNQAVSRWGIAPHAEQRPGVGRIYSSADAFAMCMAAEALKMGLTWPAARDVIYALPLQELDPETFEQIEIFPGRDRFVEALLVVTNFNADELPTARFIERVDLSRLGAEPFIAFPATRIAKMIEAYTGE